MIFIPKFFIIAKIVLTSETRTKPVCFGPFQCPHFLGSTGAHLFLYVNTSSLYFFIVNTANGTH